MTTCLTCGDPTEGKAEFCSSGCFYVMEAELGTSLDGRSTGESVVEAAEDITRRAAADPE